MVIIYKYENNAELKSLESVMKKGRKLPETNSVVKTLLLERSSITSGT